MKRITAASVCAGPLRRREFLRIGFTGLTSLTLSELLRRRAESSAMKSRENTASNSSRATTIF